MNEKSILELSPLQLVILWIISIFLLTLLGVQANGAVLNADACSLVSSVETTDECQGNDELRGVAFYDDNFNGFYDEGGVLHSVAPNHQIRIELPELASGVYTLAIHTDTKGIIRKQIIIMP